MAIVLPVSVSASEPPELNGTWIEQVYRPTREEHPSPLFPRDPATLEIDDHQFQWKHGDGTARQSLVKYVPSEATKAIDLMTVVGDEFWFSRAIYKVEGDTLTICEAVHDEPRPTEFRRWQGVLEPSTVLTTYRRNAAPSKLQVGDTAPLVEGIAPDGSPFDLKSLKGKLVLLTFWREENADLERHFSKLRDIRGAFFVHDNFQIVSVRIDDSKFTEWLAFLDKQASLEPEHPQRRLYDDSKWWHYFHASIANLGAPPFQIGPKPESYLIGPDGALLAVKVPDCELAQLVEQALQPPR
jgi:uncharacterized protein (TIGR03067 family)